MKLGNNSRMAVAGKGDVKKINGVVHVFTDVYFVPELKKIF